MASRILAGAVADGPMVRKWLRLISPIINRPVTPVLRRAASWQKMPIQQIQSPDLFIWLAPNAKTLPEDWRRYEFRIKDKNWITTYQVMIDPSDPEKKKMWHYKYDRVNYDWTITPVSWDFKVNSHNRVLVSSIFWDYNNEKNKYKPLKNRDFLSWLRDVDTDEDERAFNNLYK